MPTGHEELPAVASHLSPIFLPSPPKNINRVCLRAPKYYLKYNFKSGLYMTISLGKIRKNIMKVKELKGGLTHGYIKSRHDTQLLFRRNSNLPE